MLMSKAVLEAASNTPGKEAIAMEAFARALTEVPNIIAENGGYDAAQLVSQLRALHKQDKSTMGLGKFSIIIFKFSKFLETSLSSYVRFLELRHCKNVSTD